MSWTKGPSQFIAKTKEDHRDLTTASAIEILNGIVSDNPVDTGRSQSNWMLTQGAPSAGVSDDESAWDRSQRGGNHILSLTQQALSYSNFFPVFYLTNNLPYINELNNGSSDQAGANFVEKTIQRVTDNL